MACLTLGSSALIEIIFKFKYLQTKFIKCLGTNRASQLRMIHNQKRAEYSLFICWHLFIINIFFFLFLFQKTNFVVLRIFGEKFNYRRILLSEFIYSYLIGLSASVKKIKLCICGCWWKIFERNTGNGCAGKSWQKVLEKKNSIVPHLF